MLTCTLFCAVEKEVEEIDEFSLTLGGGSNVLGIVVFSIVLGLMIGRMGPRGKPLVLIFDLMQDAVIKIVKIIIW